jgi:hypothetical protein
MKFFMDCFFSKVLDTYFLRGSNFYGLFHCRQSTLPKNLFSFSLIMTLSKIVKFLIIISLFSLSVFAEPKDAWNKPEALVGETVVLTIVFEPTEVKNWEMPEKGFLYKDKKDEENKLPFASIKEIQKDANRYILTVVFLDTGTFSLPIHYTDFNDERFTLNQTIKIISSIEPQKDKELLDIVPPVQFSGPYLVRLLLIILFGLVVTGSIIYLLYYISQKKPIDAIIQSPTPYKIVDYYANQMDRLLSQEIVNHKEFIFMLSGFIKEKVSSIYNESIHYMTLEEIIPFLYKKSSVVATELKTNLSYFTSIKYMPDNSILSQEEAKKIYQKWKGLIR